MAVRSWSIWTASPVRVKASRPCYHHLFRDMLLAELGRLEPGMMPVLLARHLGPGSGHGPGHLADGARHRSRRDRVPGAQLGKGPDRTGRHGVSGRAYSSSQTEHTG